KRARSKLSTGTVSHSCKGSWANRLRSADSSDTRAATRTRRRRTWTDMKHPLRAESCPKRWHPGKNPRRFASTEKQPIGFTITTSNVRLREGKTVPDRFCSFAALPNRQPRYRWQQSSRWKSHPRRFWRVEKANAKCKMQSAKCKISLFCILHFAFCTL